MVTKFEGGKQTTVAGYSKRTLVDKLGIKPGNRICLVHAPQSYEKLLGKLPQDAKIAKKLQGTCDFIQFFTKEKFELESAFPGLKKSLAAHGTLWVSWPKGASKIPTDLNENVIRDVGLKIGLVDVKVCAVDDVWSGLKFVYRLKDRAAVK